MAILSTLDAARQTSQPAEKIYASDLIAAFEHYAPQIKILSLDCFDTLLWRKVMKPADLFYDLQHQPTFKALGFTAIMRVNAESTARSLKYIQLEKQEVTLPEIYLTHFPTLSAEQISALENEEITLEKESCYGFPPVMELIRRAHAKKIKIVIVSDTYFKQQQLIALLNRCLPQDVFAAIDTVFCSSDFEKAKINGLFSHVIEKFAVAPHEILHLGDNVLADFMAPKKMNMHALHLLHHQETVSDLIRMQSVAASIINPAIRDSRACYHPFRGVMAAAHIESNKPEQLIGYASLGPLMFSFARFIGDELAALQQTGKSVKVAFLMRDAYLPFLACKTLHKKEIGKRVRISRFTAIAMSSSQIHP